MIDLHLHLDGSLSPDLVLKLAREQGITLPCQDAFGVKKLLTVSEDCRNLNEYLKCFELPARVLQTGDALFRAVEKLVGRLAKQGLLYAEIRFAPQLHTRKKLSQEDAVRAALSGLKEALAQYPEFSAQLILCCMRGAGDEKNRETLALTSKYLGQGVCGLDLAGAEALYPTAGYQGLFAEAAVRGLPFTIHAGEADGPESIRSALSLGARRIGHGVRALEDPKLVSLLAENAVPLELCLTSNLQTRAISSIAEFPLRRYLHEGLCVTLNTDNMTVSDTTLAEEYHKMKENGLTGEEEQRLFQNAVKAAFLPQNEKEGLLEKLKAKKTKSV